VTGVLYTADQNGRLYSFTGTTGFDGPLAEIPLSPVRTIGVTPDGRVFASAGEGISRLYRYSPAHQELADIGVAVSTLERRRYGYSFADVATGRDGELVFAEDDNLGHIWLYFPKITSDRRS
jgi:glucose/arabinose dehydrogenase